MFQGIKKKYFHAHLKNVFLAMLSNKSADIRRIAIEKIITAEKKSLRSSSVDKAINFCCTSNQS